jgi:hypothetical protein
MSKKQFEGIEPGLWGRQWAVTYRPSPPLPTVSFPSKKNNSLVANPAPLSLADWWKRHALLAAPVLQKDNTNTKTIRSISKMVAIRCDSHTNRGQVLNTTSEYKMCQVRKGTPKQAEIDNVAKPNPKIPWWGSGSDRHPPAVRFNRCEACTDTVNHSRERIEGRRGACPPYRRHVENSAASRPVVGA